MGEKRTFYHGTNNPDEILKSGFNISDTGQFGPGVYLTSDSDTSLKWLKDKGRTNNPTALRSNVDVDDLVDLGKWPKTLPERHQMIKQAIRLREQGKGVLIRGHDKWKDLVIVNNNVATKSLSPITTYSTMSLRKEFQKLMDTKPIPPYATLPSSGIDVEWSELMKGWKIDMGMDVKEFFKRNPDIFQAIQKRLPDIDLANVSTRDILKRGVAEEILRQLIIETDIPGEADRIFKGQRLRGIATGTLTAEARNKIYERAFEKGQLPKGTSINPEGGVRHTSVLDGDYDGPYYDHTQLPKGKEGHIRKKYQKLWRDQAKTGNTSQINFWVDPKTNLEVPKGTQGAVGFRVHATKRSKTHASGWETPGIKRQTYGDTAERKLDIRSQTAPEYLTPQGKKAYNRLWDQLNAQGLEVHHTIPLHRARGMFQGLNQKSKIQLIKDWEKVGVRFGNVEGAVQGFTKADHDAIHRTYESMDAAIAKAGKTHPSVLNKDKIKTGSTFFDDLWELEAPARHRALLKNTKLLRNIGGYTGKAEAAARLAAGDYLGGGIGLALQTKPVQTQLAKRLAKLSSKAIPGVGMTLGSMETYGYARQGRWTQAGIAAFGTAFSEVPLVGDIIQGAADLTNLGIDVATGNLVPSTDSDDIATRRRLNSAIGNTDLNWRPTRFIGLYK